MINKKIYISLFLVTLFAIFAGTTLTVCQIVKEENSAINQSKFQFYTYISEIVFTNVSLADEDEYVVLSNNGFETTDLLDYRFIISDMKNIFEYMLPNFKLKPHEFVRIHFGKGATNLTDLYLNQTRNVLNDTHGDIKLIDAIGSKLSEVKY
jgi:hypothetical protein